MISAQQIPNPRSFYLQVATYFQKDARHFQIIYLSLFLVYGIFSLGWDADLSRIGLTIGTCL
ncbi:MAG TPA: hypothetical protein ENJ82_06595, partial [Bacteroidetes bacterium]|nr:hypothetical protein [Bacteroidota bacterium]